MILTASKICVFANCFYNLSSLVRSHGLVESTAGAIGLIMTFLLNVTRIILLKANDFYDF